MTAADLAARLRAELATLEAEAPAYAAATRQAREALEAAQRAARPGQALTAVMEAQSRYEATKGLEERHAADLSHMRSNLSRAEAAMSQAEKDTVARAHAERLEKVTAALDKGRETLERDAARLVTLELERTRLRSNLIAASYHADAGPFLATLEPSHLPQPAPLTPFGAHVANYSGLRPAQIDPETLEAL